MIAQARRERVEFARKGCLLARRACALLSAARSTLGYRSCLAAKDGPVQEAMQRFWLRSARFGDHWIQIFLDREGGHVMSANCTHRIWRQCELQVPSRRPRHRVAKCLGIEVAASLRSRHVIAVLQWLVSVYGGAPLPETRQRPEFVSKAMAKWLIRESVDNPYIDPDKLWQNVT